MVVRKGLFIFALYFAIVCYTKNTDIRSAWLDASQCLDESMTKEAIKIMAENGINRIYVASWKNGKVFYNSSTMYNILGNDGIGRFIINWAVKYARLYKMEIYAWFEYGYIAAYDNLSAPFGQYALKQGWIMGEVNHMFYMDPRTKATLFLAGIMADCIDEQVDGLQLDDHFSCRKKFPQCNPDVIQSATLRLDREIRIKNRTIPISLAPAPMPESYIEYSVNWPLLLSGYLIDEVVPLLYTSSSEEYKRLLEENDKYIKPVHKSKALMGIMVNIDSSKKVTKWPEVVRMINLTYDKSYSVVIWYGKSIVSDYRKEFYNLWGNHIY